ncbi:MAG: methyltransferase [Bacteroidota bacterium]|nr:methyltransferase [Bacteroidota bacterium]
MKSYFNFKQFSVKQDNSPMKIGTDSVLLGSWTNLADAGSVLDVGTGTGILALMLAQKFEPSIPVNIDAIEIDENAIADAKENFEKSKWSRGLRLLNISFQEYSFKSVDKYDLIISNPPYFINSLKSPDNSRNKARHSDSLTYEELIQSVCRLLNKNGRFCLVLPYNSEIKFKEYAFLKGLYCHKELLVKSNINSQPVRILMELSFIPQYNINSRMLVIRDENGNYTQDYKNLTSDYYLNF